MKNIITIILCLTVMLLADSVFAKEKLAVMELESLGGVDDSLVEIMTNTLKDELDAFGEYSIISREEIEALANRLALQQQTGNCTDSDCLADMGKALGTKLMVYGSLSKIGNTYSLSLRLLDTENKEAIRRVNERCKCSEEDLFNTVQKAAAKIMGKNARHLNVSADIGTGIDDPGNKYIEIASVESALTWRFMLEKKVRRRDVEKICSSLNVRGQPKWLVPSREDFKNLMTKGSFAYTKDMPRIYHTQELWGSSGTKYSTWDEFWGHRRGGFQSPSASNYDLKKNRSGINDVFGPGAEEYDTACVQTL